MRELDLQASARVGKEPHKAFALRLARSTRQAAVDLARREGISLNQFILLAVAEKILRLEMQEGENRAE